MTRVVDASLKNDRRLESFENDAEFKIALDTSGQAKGGASLHGCPALRSSRDAVTATVDQDRTS